MERNILIWRWINTGLFVVMVLLNLLANVLPIGAGNTGAISTLYPTQITPASFTFAIWGVIYALMAVFIIYQWNYRGKEAVIAIGPWFAISCLMNIVWILTWHQLLIWISVIAIAALLISLSMIQIRLSRDEPTGFLAKTVNASFDLYAGWITAATILNISVALVSSQWDRFGISEIIWTSIILIAGAIIGALPTLLKRRYFSTTAIIWAYLGIVVKQAGAAQYTAQESATLGFSVLGIVLMFFAIVFAELIRRSGCSIKRPRIHETKEA